MNAFISYSHRNEAALERLRVHLAMLQAEGSIADWYDRDILAGANVDQNIAAQLNSCELFIALVSPDFLASDYCRDIELRRAIERHDAGEIVVVPIIVKPCDWQNSPLGKLKAIPRDGKAISTWTNEDVAYLEVVNELRRLVKATQPKSKTASATEQTRNVSQSRYRIKQDFDEIDRADFRESRFRQLKEYFQRSVQEIDDLDGLRGRFRDIGPSSFSCTVLNQRKNHGEAHITVHAKTDRHGLGDIYYSFSQDAPANTANGWFTIESDGYDLFLKLNIMHGTTNDKRVSQQSASEILWKEFVQHAGIDYD